MLTEQTTIRHMAMRLAVPPGAVVHHTSPARDARINSTQIPAPLMTMRCHLLGSTQASETSQYIAGEKQRSNPPRSWTSPPNALHENPWPSS